MSEHDLEKNGVITYLEFKALFLDLEDLESAQKIKNGDLRAVMKK